MSCAPVLAALSTAVCLPFLIQTPVHAESPAAATTAPASAPVRPPCADFIDLLEAPFQVMTKTYDEAQRQEEARTGFDPMVRITLEDVVWKMGSGPAGEQCRAALAQEQAPDFLRAMNRSLQGAGIQETGHAVLCALHPPVAWAIAWMTATGCIEGLAEIDEQPAARRVVDLGVAATLHLGPPPEGRQRTEWAIQPPDGARRSLRLRQRLARLLAPAHKHHAAGYDRFWALECSDKRGPLAVDQKTCAEFPPQEHDWHLAEARLNRRIKVGVILLPALGVLTATVAQRNNEIGRGTASLGAALGAGTLMATIVDASGRSDPPANPDFGFGDAARTALSVVLGIGAAVTGGIVAYDSLAGSPGGRIGVAATGMAVFTACMLRFTWDD